MPQIKSAPGLRRAAAAPAVYTQKKRRLTAQLVNDAKVSDHHALLPTEQVTVERMAELPGGERNILLLITYRLLAAAYTPHLYTAMKAELDIGGEMFSATGRTERDRGFLLVTEAVKGRLRVKEEDTEPQVEAAPLPALRQGGSVTVLALNSEEKKTKPPQAYTEDTLLAAMETAGREIEDAALKEAIKGSGLGTPATRAGIIEGMIKTGYAERKGKKLLPTANAQTFIDLVTPEVKTPVLTAQWEKRLYDIEHSAAEPADFLSDIAAFVGRCVGAALTNKDAGEAAVFRPHRVKIGACPRCGKDVVELSKSYACESGKDGCGFVIWKKIAGKNMTKTQAVKLLEKRKTDLIEGFTSKAGKKFSAYLILKDDGNFGFDFPGRSAK